MNAIQPALPQHIDVDVPVLILSPTVHCHLFSVSDILLLSVMRPEMVSKLDKVNLVKVNCNFPDQRTKTAEK